MTLEQKIRKAIYPIVMAAGKLVGMKYGIEKNNTIRRPRESFYLLTGLTIDGKLMNFSTLKGKKVLLVNTASDCGYTGQYDDLEKLHQQFGRTLVVIGFPANDFKEQEKGNDEDIATFCRRNYGVTFTLMKKSTVIKGDHQNDVYNWLTSADKNGWNDKAPEWNFAKYLVNEEGVLTHYFSPAVSPMSQEILQNL
jgi:glutathione peroxidase